MLTPIYRAPDATDEGVALTPWDALRKSYCDFTNFEKSGSKADPVSEQPSV